jgi:hypothetical protein
VSQNPFIFSVLQLVLRDITASLPLPQEGGIDMAKVLPRSGLQRKRGPFFQDTCRGPIRLPAILPITPLFYAARPLLARPFSFPGTASEAGHMVSKGLTLLTPQVPAALQIPPSRVRSLLSAY